MRFPHDDQSKNTAITHTFYVPNLTLKNLKFSYQKSSRIRYLNLMNYIIHVNLNIHTHISNMLSFKVEKKQ